MNATRTWVTDFLSRSQAVDPPGIEDISEVAPHPHADLAACTLTIRATPMQPTQQRVALVDLARGRLRLAPLPHETSARAAWSPDGNRLALVAQRRGTPAQACVLAASSWDPEAWDRENWDAALVAESDLRGLVESCSWSPDGSRLGLLVALPGAGISDVYGSGVVTIGDREPSWTPRVLPDVSAGRRAFVWQVNDAVPTQVTDANVWELAWAGDDAMLALVSEDADEGGWYAAVLTRLDLCSGDLRLLHSPPDQLAQPRSAPDGLAWSVLAGLQSDRGLPAGELLVSRNGAAATPVDTAQVHVTDHHWLDRTRIRFTGLRGLRTVVGTVDTSNGTTDEVWSGAETSGRYFPEVSDGGDPPVVVLEDHRMPPTLGVLERGGFRRVLACKGSGPSFQVERAGRTTEVSWRSADGLRIEGLLTLPEGEPPYATIVHIHGGPVHAWRNSWSGRDPHTAVLVARGYAVLRPNVRGSTGRGNDFAARVRGDMGGGDLDDVVSGIEHLVRDGVADPDRIGITGISYGGFMAAWAPCRSSAFAASVVRSPATDWRAQHLTSDIAAFDRRFLTGDPFDEESQYRSRSPLSAHQSISTPMLLTAGGRDLATPAHQAHVLHSALVRRGVPSVLAVYPEEGHGVRHPEAIADECARMVEWFERFMPARPGEVSP